MYFSPRMVVTLPLLIVKLSIKFSILLLTLKGPTSKNWGILMKLSVKMIKAFFTILPDLPMEEIQFLCSIRKYLPYRGLHIQTTAVPDQFRERAYGFLRTNIEKKYGFYPQPKENHWALGKPLEIQWIKNRLHERSKPQSAIYYIHGGAYVLGHSSTYYHVFAELLKESSSSILAVNYRLGPKYTMTSIIEDVIAAYFYLIAPESQGGGGMDSSQVIVGGDSAGGGLASNLIHILRNFLAPLPAGAFLWCPAIDRTYSQPSVVENRSKDILSNVIQNPIIIGKHFKLYTNEALFMYKQSSPEIRTRMLEDGSALGPFTCTTWPEMSPMLDPNMDNLPPTFIITSEWDTLRDPSIVYGKRRAEAEKRAHSRGSIIPNVQTVVYEDMPHCFMNMPGDDRNLAAVVSTSEFIYQALNASDENKLEEKHYQYLPDFNKAYVDTKYNMYWNTLKGDTIPWESPYSITPFPNLVHSTDTKSNL